MSVAPEPLANANPSARPGGGRRVRLQAPPGYGAVVPLEPRQHAGLGLPAQPDYRWCAGLNAVYVSAPEFGRAMHDYPIALARVPHSGEFQPVAIMGLRSGQNLFVDAQGRWRDDAYVPAYCRRYPFCIAEIPGEDHVDAPRRLVCVSPDGLTRDTPAPLFGADGSPNSAWKALHGLIERVEAARMQTRVLCRRLEALDLLRPFDALALPRKGPQQRLHGIYRVDEDRLSALPARQLRALMSKGELRAIYAHLLSLENFARLLDRATAHATASG